MHQSSLFNYIPESATIMTSRSIRSCKDTLKIVSDDPTHTVQTRCASDSVRSWASPCSISSFLASMTQIFPLFWLGWVTNSKYPPRRMCFPAIFSSTRIELSPAKRSLIETRSGVIKYPLLTFLPEKIPQICEWFYLSRDINLLFRSASRMGFTGKLHDMISFHRCVLLDFRRDSSIWRKLGIVNFSDVNAKFKHPVTFARSLFCLSFLLDNTLYNSLTRFCQNLFGCETTVLATWRYQHRRLYCGKRKLALWYLFLQYIDQDRKCACPSQPPRHQSFFC